MEQILAFLKNPYFVQGIGIVGMAVSLMPYHFKEYNKVVLLRMAAELIFGFQFLLLGAYTGMATNFAAVGTNSVYRYRINHGKPTRIFQVLFSLLFIVLGVVTWAGPVSLLVIAAKLLSTIAFGINNTKTIRIMNMAIQPLWLVYDIVVFSIGGMIADALAIVSVTSAFFRLDVKKQSE